jgi:mono/diheme cytochrome c family protein
MSRLFQPSATQPITFPASRPERCSPSSQSRADATASGPIANPIPAAQSLFQGNCTSCQSAEGQGSKDGYYPSLFRNSATGARNATNLVAAILYGVNRTTSRGQAFMPGFGGHATDANPLSDRDIVVLGNYVLAHYGSADTTITEQQVAEERRGGPSSPLLALARGGMAAAAVVVFLGIVFLIVRRRKSSA